MEVEEGVVCLAPRAKNLSAACPPSAPPRRSVASGTRRRQAPSPLPLMVVVGHKQLQEVKEVQEQVEVEVQVKSVVVVW